MTSLETFLKLFLSKLKLTVRRSTSLTPTIKMENYKMEIGFNLYIFISFFLGGVLSVIQCYNKITGSNPADINRFWSLTTIWYIKPSFILDHKQINNISSSISSRFGGSNSHFQTIMKKMGNSFFVILWYKAVRSVTFPNSNATEPTWVLD